MSDVMAIPVNPCDLVRGDTIRVYEPRFGDVEDCRVTGGAVLVPENKGYIRVNRMTPIGVRKSSFFAPYEVAFRVVPVPDLRWESTRVSHYKVPFGRLALDEAGDIAYRHSEDVGCWLRIDGNWTKTPRTWLWSQEKLSVHTWALLVGGPT